MNCPHGAHWYACDEAACIEVQKKHAAQLAEQMRGLIAKLSRCRCQESLPAGEAWCVVCGSRFTAGSWDRPTVQPWAKILDERWRLLGVDLAERAADEEAN